MIVARLSPIPISFCSTLFYKIGVTWVTAGCDITKRHLRLWKVTGYRWHIYLRWQTLQQHCTQQRTSSWFFKTTHCLSFMQFERIQVFLGLHIDMYMPFKMQYCSTCCMREKHYCAFSANHLLSVSPAVRLKIVVTDLWVPTETPVFLQGFVDKMQSTEPLIQEVLWGDVIAQRDCWLAER